MQSALVFPPFLVSYQPYSSLPALAGFLRGQGFTVALLDENIEYQAQRLRRIHFDAIEAGVQTLRADCARLDSDDGRSLGRYLDSCFRPEYFAAVAAGLEDAIAGLRNSHILADVCKADQARSVLNRAQNLVHQFNKVFELSVLGYGKRQGGLTWQDIALLSAHRANPYTSFLRSETIPRLSLARPALIGISLVFEDQLVAAFTLVREIRREPALADVHIVIGGPVVTILQDEIRNSPELFDAVDSFVVYEGEWALVNLLRAVESGAPLDAVPNLIYRVADVVKSNDIAVIPDLDVLPTPDYHGLPLEKYFSPRMVPVLQTTRGCYWGKCTFCNSSFLNAGPRYRSRSAAKIYEDFVGLHERFGLSEFALWEEAAVPRVLRDLAVLIAGGAYRFKWFAEVRLDKVFSYDLLSTLYRGGCRAFVFGFESGSVRVQGLMNKGYDLAVSSQVIRDCRKVGIRVYLTNMVGFPSEASRDVFDTLAFLKANARYIYHAGVSHFGLRRYTDTWRFPERFGICVDSSAPTLSAGGDLSYQVDPERCMSLNHSLAFYDLVRREIKRMGLEGGEPEAHYLIRCH
ncbi:B12-binding domain-containing radical SAM protein [Candidatus Thiodictyon syntrophicum]|jgi:hypothetical protein|uniref:Elp3/MiaA/NifB-like radical SAM core domain-containing protein n=1 Tax=Candidatus Thiodictyon syntrophicum TaxID=1166950 RepID=A0A2K8U8Z8_9GAMM|nr:radical SAM protein [Candidatus Thiodictyon syntrophicum]AUB82043.1 hypothetical protein THSYN_14550 [Candidatus Thiodictyon syntrophicum]